MKILRFLSVAILVMLISIISGFIFSYQAQEVSRSRYDPPAIAFTNFQNLPDKVTFSLARDFANIAWKTFVTLNWPANYDGRPLEHFVLGQAPLAPRVWEFYRTPEEVFLPDGANPLLNSPNPFAIRPLKLDLFKGQGSGSLEDSEEDSDLAQNLRKSRALIEKFITGECPGTLEICAEEKNLDFNKIPLVDRQGNYIISEIHLNHNEFQQILDHQWYDANKLTQYNNDNSIFQFESKSNIDSPIEVKAAWRVFDQSASAAEKARYYTTKRVIAIPEEQYICAQNQCPRAGKYVLQEVEVGLIGFHIAYKIPNQQASKSGWVWASFEQVDNLRKVESESVQLNPTLSNPHCETDQNYEHCQPNYPYIEWPFLWRDQAPHAVTLTKDRQIQAQIPTQVMRVSGSRASRNSERNDQSKASLKELDEATQNAIAQDNKKWQQAFKAIANDSVWQYYELLGTQWLKNPQITINGNHEEFLSKIRIERIMPAKLVNVSMEAYSQYQENGNSCIACHVSSTLPISHNHSQAVFSDFSFLLERAESSPENNATDP